MPEEARNLEVDAGVLDHARQYAQRGWRVLPIKPQTKRPPMGAWQTAATTDETTISSWWTDLYRGHGIGVATGQESGIFVLDVDVADGKRGDETLAQLEELYGQLPDTPTVVTPSGGLHYYFKLPAGLSIRNDAGKRLGPWLDIRGEGGQVVAPPTVRAGQMYVWRGETYNLEPAEPPRWMLNRLAESPSNLAPNPLVERSAPALRDAGDEYSAAASYNERTTWAELLEADGWTLAELTADGEQRWARPGKDAREGISATVGHGGGDQLTVFTSSLEWLPEGSYSRFGYYACREHGGDRSGAARALHEADYADVTALLDRLPMVEAEPQREINIAPVNRSELAHIIDWATFWDSDQSDEDWLAYPIVPRGRAIALYAPAKAGKSTIVLAVAAAAATGRPILGHRVADPVTVLYLDYEMTSADLQQRLLELGYGPEDDLSRLKYALLPSLPPLDTIEGARAVLDLVDEHSADFVVVDTFGRAVAGEEDHADTVRAFYRHTGLTLKAKGVTYLRTDHAGKDVDRGMRGSSAKNDDVDLVWKLQRADTQQGHAVKLTRTHSRISWVPETLTISRVETDDGFDYLLDAKAEIYPDGTASDVALLYRGGR
jgi:hypothetical protein